MGLCAPLRLGQPTRLAGGEFKLGNAGGLSDLNARRRARFDMGHAILRAGAGIEEGVEHAAARAELDLEAIAFADLQFGATEAPDQLGPGQADEGASLARLRDDRGDRGRFRLLGHLGAAGGAQEGESEDAAHGRIMPSRTPLGKVAAHRARR